MILEINNNDKAEFLNIGKSDYKTCGKDYANFAFDHLICFYQE